MMLRPSTIVYRIKYGLLQPWLPQCWYELSYFIVCNPLTHDILGEIRSRCHLHSDFPLPRSRCGRCRSLDWTNIHRQPASGEAAHVEQSSSSSRPVCSLLIHGFSTDACASFGAAIAGLVSIRAFGAQPKFGIESLARIDRYTRSARNFFNLNREIILFTPLVLYTLMTSLDGSPYVSIYWDHYSEQHLRRTLSISNQLRQATLVS